MHKNVKDFRVVCIFVGVSSGIERLFSQRFPLPIRLVWSWLGRKPVSQNEFIKDHLIENDGKLVFKVHLNYFNQSG